MGESMTELADVWASLATQGTQGDGYLRLRVAGHGDWSVYAAVAKPSGLAALLLEVPTRAVASIDAIAFSSRGLRIGVTPLVSGSKGRSMLVLGLESNEFSDVFFTFSTAIVSELRRAETSEDATKTLNGQLARWIRFLEQFSSDALSEQAQLGLFGELIVLGELVEIVGAREAAQAWCGPAAAPQDFQLRDVGLEVKSTRAGPPHVVRVTSLRQLDGSKLARLFLKYLVFDRMEGDGGTLPDVVQRLRSMMSSDFTALRDFENKLADAGYLDAHVAQYSRVGFIGRQNLLLDVRKGFPRISPASVPPGVGEVSYTVQLGALTQFVVDHAQLRTQLLGGAS